MPPSATNEDFWRPLLELIGKKMTVPVVGEEMLQVPGEPVGRTLYNELAVQYAVDEGIQLNEALIGNLSATVRNHREFNERAESIGGEIASRCQNWQGPIPEPLRALAKIRDFKLFVSTTFDNLLERALIEERGEPVQVISFAPNNIPDDETVAGGIKSGNPVILQLLGNCEDPLGYALTDAEVLEYVHALEANSKKRLVTELYNRPLLLLGNSFPDWLTRILLRLARNHSLDVPRQPAIYIADSQVGRDYRLRFFLSNFVRNIHLAEQQTAPEFVQDLSSRWLAKHTPQPKVSVPSASLSPGQERDPMTNSVFISYCRSDRSGKPTLDGRAAFALREALHSCGVKAWLDKDQLEPGDYHRVEIPKYINMASVFVALISPRTDERESYFRTEWHWARERLKNRTGIERPFIVPVFLGPINWSPQHLPPEFAAPTYQRMESEQPDVKLIERLKYLYERAVLFNS